jgi:hypothetical protein
MADENDPSLNWEEARLIPVSGIRNAEEQERRATSALLAVLKSLELLADEQERNGQRENLRKLCEEQQRRWDAFFKEQDAAVAKYLELIAERGGA